MKKLVLEGLKFGKLWAVKELGKSVECRCDCGNIKTILRSNLMAGYTQSCGCIQKEKTRERNTTHGNSGTRIYNIWKGMHKRCYNSACDSYPWYGAKGIEVCERWHDFSKFLQDMLPTYADDLTIDRKESSKNYCPENCQWVTQAENSRRALQYKRRSNGA